MTTRQKKFYQKEIKMITERIVQEYKPEKIILFGSFAWGKPTRDSDVDLFVVKKTRLSKDKRISQLENTLLERNAPIDFLIYNPEEVKSRLSLGDFFIRDIIQKGKIIYENK